MIDISTEQLVTPARAGRVRPPGRNNRPTHPSTVYRWITRGVRGVRLEGVRIGGTLYTSVEALQRFADQLSDTPPRPPGPRGGDRTAAELNRLGL